MSIPRGAFRTTLFVAGGLTILAGAFLVWLQMVAWRSATERMTERVTEAVAEARAEGPRRPGIRGGAVHGSAWQGYEQALALSKGVGVLGVRPWVVGTAGADPAKAATVLGANRR